MGLDIISQWRLRHLIILALAKKAIDIDAEVKGQRPTNMKTKGQRPTDVEAKSKNIRSKIRKSSKKDQVRDQIRKS